MCLMPGPIDLSSCQASPESSPGLETFGSIERREVSVAWPGALCWWPRRLVGCLVTQAPGSGQWQHAPACVGRRFKRGFNEEDAFLNGK